MVMVSHAHNFVFLKTQKTAGTSTEMFLQSYVCDDAVGPPEKTHAVETEDLAIGARLIGLPDFRPLDAKWHEHMTAAQVRENLGKQRWADYYKIANVRDPFDLTVSQFLFRWKRAGRDALTSPKEMVAAFREWIVNAPMMTIKEIVWDKGACVVDRFIRFEHLVDDLKDLCAKFGWAFDETRLPRTKRTDDARLGLHPADFHDDRTKAITRKRFEWMFEVGNYAEEVA